MGKVIAVLAVIVAAIAAVIGYVMNIVKLFKMTNVSDQLGEFVVRLIGVLTGVVGAIAGYF